MVEFLPGGPGGSMPGSEQKEEEEEEEEEEEIPPDRPVLGARLGRPPHSTAHSVPE